MAVSLKRSTPDMCILNECEYGCCTDVYGKNVRRIRRQVRRVGERNFRRELRNGQF